MTGRARAPSTHFPGSPLRATYTLHLSPDTAVALDNPVSSDGKESACNSENVGSIPRSGRFPGEGNGYPSSILAGEFYGQTVESQRVGYDWMTNTSNNAVAVAVIYPSYTGLRKLAPDPPTCWDSHLRGWEELSEQAFWLFAPAKHCKCLTGLHSLPYVHTDIYSHTFLRFYMHSPPDPWKNIMSRCTSLFWNMSHCPVL